MAATQNEHGNSEAPSDAEAADPAERQSGSTGVGRRRDALRCAFVVQLAPDPDPASGEFCGRVDNLATNDGGNFASADGLLVILRRLVSRVRGGGNMEEGK